LLLKSFLSSPDALRESLQARLQSPRLAQDDPAAAADRALLGALDAAAKKVGASENTKLQRLIELLRGMGIGPEGTERVVVFSERIATLEFLREALQKALGLSKDQVELFRGELGDQEQQRLVKEFGSEQSAVRVLLASDAASEGVNLHHFCSRLVHYDIPWSLITLELRNGRIDRFGQTSEPELHYLISVPGDADTRGDLRVLDVLIEKEHAAHQNLGDVRWLMNLHDPEAEEERIAEGISQKESPESILPDPEPQTDFLAVLMDMAHEAAARRGATTGQLELPGATPEPPDFATAPPNATEAPPVSAPLSLFPSDLEFAKDAFQELLDSEPAGLPKEARLEEPQWEDHIQGFTLKAPLDLEQRYRYLPPELTRAQGFTFKLTS